MNFFRINLQRSMRSYTIHNVITAPANQHEGFTTMMKIKRGDILLICNGKEETLEHIAVASHDSYIGNISYFEKHPVLACNAMFTVETKLLKGSLDKHLNVIKETVVPGCFSKDNTSMCQELRGPDFSTNELRIALNQIMAGVSFEDNKVPGMTSYLNANAVT